MSYEGLIVDFLEDSIVVFLRPAELPVKGYIPINDLKDDVYVLDPGTMTLKGKKSTKYFRLDQRIKVKVKQVNTAIIFSYLSPIA